jgi:hypothetical protein
MTVAAPAPRWRDVFLGLVVGEILAAAVLLVPILGLFWLRLAPLSTGPRHGFFEWPFTFDGVWSVTSDLTILAALAVAGGSMVARVLVSFLEQPVSRRRTAAVLFVAGGVPLAWSHGAVPEPLLAFAASAAGIRSWAVGRGDPPLSRAAIAAAVAVAAGLLLSAGGYGALHPLRVSGSVGPGPGIVLSTDSPFTVEVTGVRPAPFAGAPGFAPLHVRIPPRRVVAVYLHRACHGLRGAGTVDEVVVTYRVLGRVEHQLLSLSQPYRLVCP